MSYTPDYPFIEGNPAGPGSFINTDLGSYVVTEEAYNITQQQAEAIEKFHKEEIDHMLPLSENRENFEAMLAKIGLTVDGDPLYTTNSGFESPQSAFDAFIYAITGVNPKDKKK